MDLLSQTLTIAGAIAVGSFIIGLLNYFSNKKKISNEDKEKATENEARLVSMEKDIQYIRAAVDGINTKLDKHEQRLIKLESRHREENN